MKPNITLQFLSGRVSTTLLATVLAVGLLLAVDQQVGWAAEPASSLTVNSTADATDAS